VSGFVGRGGEKLAWAISRFGVSAAGRVCCDLGANVGGFTDALLQAGAAKVYAVETGYGLLDWKLRNDPRVVVLERTNALRVELPEPVGLVASDVGWTRQEILLPRAAGLLSPDGEILSLLKPQYEAAPAERRGGRVREEALPAILERVRTAAAGVLPLLGLERTPFAGGKGGNPEWFLHLRRGGEGPARETP